MNGMTEDTVKAASNVLNSLPAQFLALVLLNTAFLGGLLWFLNSVDSRRVAFEQAANEARERVLGPILTLCATSIPAEVVMKQLQQLQQPQKPDGVR